MAYKHSKAQIKANNNYQKRSMTQLNLRLHNNNEKDIISFLKNIQNKRKYIIDLIRKDMEEKK